MAANSSAAVYHCSGVKGAEKVSMAFILIHVFLLLPLAIFVLGLALWRWWRRLAASSHSDVFTCHFAAMELVLVLGILLCVCGKVFGLPALVSVSVASTSVFLPGQMPFHVLTCLERHLAVVHPVLYLRLRRSSGVRVRNAAVGCVWLLYGAWIGVSALYLPDVPYIEMFCALAVFLAVVSFCSLSVLVVLLRPGPGRKGGTGGLVHQSKRRAFHTIAAISLALWLYFVGMLASLAVDKSALLSYDGGCLVLAWAGFYGLPCSLVLPLLCLQRAGRLRLRHHSRE